jgi:pimeloyl-ACP methyl ester carboxylesterase
MAEAELGACSVYDYAEDIDEVVTELELSDFVTVAHSIGCLVALKHAEVGLGQPRGLALYSPAPTQSVGGYDFPSFGPGRCVPAFDREAARYWFFYDIADEDLDRYVGLLGPESSTVLDASGRTAIDVSPARVSGPVLVISAACDVIQGANAGLDHAVAREFGAEYRVVRNHGHLLLVENRWEEGLGPLVQWLDCHFPATVGP